MRMSHYVLRDLVETVERGDMEAIRAICLKYSERYDEDTEIAELCNLILESIENKKFDVEGDELKDRLRKIFDSRKITSSGGTNLWFSDRRSSSGR